MYFWKLLSELNTIEGLLERAIAGLGQDQPVRKVLVRSATTTVNGTCTY